MIVQIKLSNDDKENFTSNIEKLNNTLQSIQFLSEKRQLLVNLLNYIYNNIVLKHQKETNEDFEVPPLFDPTETKLNVGLQGDILIIDVKKEETNEDGSI